MRTYKELKMVKQLSTSSLGVTANYGLEWFDFTESFSHITLLATVIENNYQVLSRESRLGLTLAAKDVSLLHVESLAKAILAELLVHKSVSGEQNKQIHLLLYQKIIEMTIPDESVSRLQKYRLTTKDQELIKENM